MNREESAVSRRGFLQRGAAVGLGVLAGGRVKGSAWAASKETRHHSQLKRHRHPQSVQS